MFPFHRGDVVPSLSQAQDGHCGQVPEWRACVNPYQMSADASLPQTLHSGPVDATDRRGSTTSTGMDLCSQSSALSPFTCLMDNGVSTPRVQGSVSGDNWMGPEPRQPLTASFSGSGHASDTNHPVSPCSRMAVPGLLNPVSPIMAPTPMSFGSVPPSARAIPSSPSRQSTARQQGSSSQSSFFLYTPSTSFISLSSISNASGGRACPINTLYYACVDATTTYVAALPPLHRTRWPHRHHHRYHPYRQFPHRYSTPAAGAEVPTVMENISMISTYLWNRARLDRIAPYRAEAAALKDMSDLYAWGKTVSRGFEGWDDVVGEELNAPAGLAGLARDVWLARKVGDAARKLCVWVDDAEAVELVEREVDHLKVLSRREGGRGVEEHIE